MAAYNLDTPYEYIARLVSLAADLVIDNQKRVTHDEAEGYFTHKNEAEQLAALLIVTRDYADFRLAEHDKAVKAFQPGGAS